MAIRPKTDEEKEQERQATAAILSTEAVEGDALRHINDDDKPRDFGIVDHVIDLVKSPLRGAAKGTAETLRAVGSVLASSQPLKIGGMVVPSVNVRKDVGRILQAYGRGTSERIDEVWGEPQSLPSGMVQSLFQWATPATGIASAMGKASSVSRNIMRWWLAGSVADFAAFDPYEERISHMLVQVPELQNPFFEWLASEEGKDSEFEARVQQAIEGGLLGAATGLTASAVMRIARVVKGSRMAQSSVLNLRKKFIKPKIKRSPAEEVVEDSIPNPGEAAPRFVDTTSMNLTDLKSLLGRDITPDDLTRVLDRLNSDEPIDIDILVETVNGKPSKILRGEEFVILGDKVGAENLNVQTVERLTRQSLDASYRRIEKGFTERARRAKSLRDAATKILSLNNITDANASMKRRLLERGGAHGRQAVQNFVLSAGATPKGLLAFQRASDRIWAPPQRKLAKFGALKEEDELTLNRYITDLRKLQTGRIKQARGAKLTDAERRELVDTDGHLQRMGLDNGVERDQFFRRRAELYFEAVRDNVRLLRDEGIINQKEQDAAELLWSSPGDLLKMVDPDAADKALGLGESGIPSIRSIDLSTIGDNHKELLAQLTIRTHNRIMRNRASLDLLQMAKDLPDNGVVSFTKQPFMKKLTVRVDGKPESFWMDEEFADMWARGAINFAQGSRAIRWASGSPVLKALATGVNPEFALTNLPRDIMHAYMASDARVGYSAHVPKFLGQMLLRDIPSVAMDAIRRRGRFNDYINEGGGMGFLTHQGTNVLSAEEAVGERGLLGGFTRGKFSKLDPGFRRAWQALSYFNETSEILVRLAIRERGMRNGLTGPEATYFAREYLDFAQGGAIIKHLDNAIPYLNASTQAVRTALRGLGPLARGEGRKPLDARGAAKLMNLAGIATSIHAYNYYTDRDGYEAIPDDIKAKNWIIMTGNSFLDNNGDRRHSYVTIRRDDTMIPFLAPFDALSIRYFGGRAPHETLLDTVTSSLPLVEGTIPVYNMFKAYGNNRDFWLNDDIWRAPGGLPNEPGMIDPLQEVNRFPRRPTSSLAIGTAKGIAAVTDALNLGEEVHISPSRLEGSLSAVLPKNTYTWFVGKGWETITGEMDEYNKQKTDRELYYSTPGRRKVLRMTHPAQVPMMNALAVGREANTALVENIREIDALTERHFNGEVDEQDVMDHILTNVPDEFKDSIQRRFSTLRETELALNSLDDRNAVPHRLWWINMAQSRAPTRAAVFYYEWSRRDKKQREQMQTLAGQLEGFWDKTTMAVFQRIVKEEGESID